MLCIAVAVQGRVAWCLDAVYFVTSGLVRRACGAPKASGDTGVHELKPMTRAERLRHSMAQACTN